MCSFLEYDKLQVLLLLLLLLWQPSQSRNDGRFGHLNNSYCPEGELHTSCL